MLSMRHAPLLSAALVLAGLMAAAWPFTVDDAFIAVRYAERIAGGLGYTFSGSHASDGVTGPLWLLPLVVGSLVGAPLLPLAKLLSAAAGLVAACWLVARLRERARGRPAAWCAVAVSASSLPFVAWSIAGLETGLAAALVSGLVVAVFAGRGVQAGLTVAALAWLRPELALFAGVLLCALERRALRRALALALLGSLLLLGFRWLTFAHALPMSASAKPPLLANGWHYLIAAIVTPRAALLTLAFALAFFQARRDRRLRWLGLAVLAHALAVLLAGGDWMPARRLFVPIVPAFALLLALGLRRVQLRHPRAMFAAMALLLLSSARELAVELPALREAGALRELHAPELARMACTGGPIALIDVGVLGTLCPGSSLIDLGGLTEPHVAYAHGGHLDKRIEQSWLRAQRPGVLVLHSRERPRLDAERRLRWFAGYPVERRVLAFPFVREFRVRDVLAYAPAYFYVVLEPPVPPR
jgi:hypothetical protein